MCSTPEYACAPKWRLPSRQLDMGGATLAASPQPSASPSLRETGDIQSYRFSAPDACVELRFVGHE